MSEKLANLIKKFTEEIKDKKNQGILNTAIQHIKKSTDFDFLNRQLNDLKNKFETMKKSYEKLGDKKQDRVKKLEAIEDQTEEIQSKLKKHLTLKTNDNKATSEYNLEKQCKQQLFMELEKCLGPLTLLSDTETSYKQAFDILNKERSIFISKLFEHLRKTEQEIDEEKEKRKKLEEKKKEIEKILEKNAKTLATRSVYTAEFLTNCDKYKVSVEKSQLEEIFSEYDKERGLGILDFFAKVFGKKREYQKNPVNQVIIESCKSLNLGVLDRKITNMKEETAKKLQENIDESVKKLKDLNAEYEKYKDPESPEAEKKFETEVKTLIDRVKIKKEEVEKCKTTVDTHKKQIGEILVKLSNWRYYSDAKAILGLTNTAQLISNIPTFIKRIQNEKEERYKKEGRVKTGDELTDFMKKYIF